MSSQRLVRLKAEMAMMAKNPTPGIHCWLKESNSEVIMVEMDGPDGSPYEKGIFQLEVVLSDRYPFTPPNIRFITPVYHPNIDPKGRICLTALKPKPTGSWAVNLNIATVLGAIRILLSEPNLSDPLMADIATQYSDNYEAYRQQAEAETLKYAKKISGHPRSSGGNFSVDGNLNSESRDSKENRVVGQTQKESSSNLSENDTTGREQVSKKQRLM